MLSVSYRLNIGYRHVVKTENRLRVACTERFKLFNRAEHFHIHICRVQFKINSLNRERHFETVGIFVYRLSESADVFRFKSYSRGKHMSAEMSQALAAM